METLVKKKIYKGEVTQISQAAKDLFYIKIKADGICAKAGQFISIYCGELTLRRPFSVMSAKDNELTVLFKLKGKGTDYMRKLSVGDVVDFSGAFGNGFHIENKKSLYSQIHSSNDYILEDENIDHVLKTVGKIGIMKELESHLEACQETVLEYDLANQLQNALQNQIEQTQTCENAKYSTLKTLELCSKSKTTELNK